MNAEPHVYISKRLRVDIFAERVPIGSRGVFGRCRNTESKMAGDR